MASTTLSVTLNANVVNKIKTVSSNTGLDITTFMNHLLQRALLDIGISELQPQVDANETGQPVVYGGWEGRVFISDDFNDPIDDFEDYMGCEGEDLQDDVGDNIAQQVFFLAGVKQRHGKDGNVDALFLGENAPPFLDFDVIASKAVDGVDIEQVAGVELVNHTLPGRAGKILAR